MKNSYTTPALFHASGSQYKILLTNIHNLKNDLANYPLRESATENMLGTILGKLEDIEKDRKNDLANYLLQESVTENMLGTILGKLEDIEKDRKQEENKVYKKIIRLDKWM